FELSRRLYRKIGRLLALEDAIDISGCAPVLVERIGSIRDQAAGLAPDRAGVDCGQPMAGRQRDDEIAMRLHRRCWPDHDNPAVLGPRERRNVALDLIGGAPPQWGF